MKERILDTAEKRFFQYGLRKVTMDEIASDLGISKKTLYKHYSGKEDLARGVIKKFQDGIVALLENMKQEVPNPVERFERLIIEVSKRRSAMCNQFPVDIKMDIPDLWEDIEDFKKRQLMVYTGHILQEGIEKELIRDDINTEIAAIMYQSAIQSLVCPETMEENHFSVDEIFSNISKIFLEGVKLK